MKLATSFIATAAAILSAATVNAAPAARSVWLPTITSPTAETAWTIGTQVNVTWNTNNAPSGTSSLEGRIILAQSGRDAAPLSDWFDLVAANGVFTVTVPITFPTNNYQIHIPVSNTVSGDGDNSDLSPSFSIVAA